MASELAQRTTRYGLLHFSPYPERGERVCVGIWFDDGGRVSIEYDQRFHRLHCIAPEFNVKFVRILLDDLDRSLRDVGSSGAEIVMRQYEPQLISTEARRIVAPLTHELREKLRNKFLVSRREVAAMELLSTGAQRIADDETSQRVREYVRSLVPQGHVQITERATPYRLFGIRSQIKTPSVALAIETPRKVVVIDGVDLNVPKARRALARVDQIVYAFWQFARMRGEVGLFRDDRTLRRVGIILNGTPTHDGVAREVHDYAIDRFKDESEVTVDTTTNEGREQLITTLAE